MRGKGKPAKREQMVYAKAAEKMSQMGAQPGNPRVERLRWKKQQMKRGKC